MKNELELPKNIKIIKEYVSSLTSIKLKKLLTNIFNWSGEGPIVSSPFKDLVIKYSKKFYCDKNYISYQLRSSVINECLKRFLDK